MARPPRARILLRSCSMTLIELVALLAMIALVNASMLVARLWSAGVGVALLVGPFVLVGTYAAVGIWLEWRELRTRLPRAWVIKQRAS